MSLFSYKFRQIISGPSTARWGAAALLWAEHSRPEPRVSHSRGVEAGTEP